MNTGRESGHEFIAKSKHRGYQFSLRLLFVVITLFGVWLGRELSWLKNRHDWLEAKDYIAAFPATGVREVPHPHLVLTLFREEAICQILLRNATEAEMTEARNLFPEADVISGNWGAPSLGEPVHVGKRAVRDWADLVP